jgi:hypothetical protein
MKLGCFLYNLSTCSYNFQFDLNFLTNDYYIYEEI